VIAAHCPDLIFAQERAASVNIARPVRDVANCDNQVELLFTQKTQRRFEPHIFAVNIANRSDSLQSLCCAHISKPPDQISKCVKFLNS
jgi:hypothetical protein